MIGLPWKIIGPVIAIIAVAGLVYWAGYSRRDADDLRDHISTTERINEAEDDIGSRDDAGVLDWLHERSK